MSFQIVITFHKFIVWTYVSSGKTWSGYLSHPEQYSIIANPSALRKTCARSCKLSSSPLGAWASAATVTGGDETACMLAIRHGAISKQAAIT
jgi:hypothetical protein